tara:strand:- start:783 stop:1049 length:267 start_codon:yes stop_codon:yes gene_type:complete
MSESFNYSPKLDLVDKHHEDWVNSGPSTLVSEMISLIEETKRDKGFVLSQEAAMLACVDSKRNAELRDIHLALDEIAVNTKPIEALAW